MPHTRAHRCISRTPQVIEALLAAKADPSIPSSTGVLPMPLAASARQWRLALRLAAATNSVNAVVTLGQKSNVRSGVCASRHPKQEWTLCMGVRLYCAIPICLCRVTICHCQSKGRTLLHFAAAHGDHKVPAIHPIRLPVELVRWCEFGSGLMSPTRVITSIVPVLPRR